MEGRENTSLALVWTSYCMLVCTAACLSVYRLFPAPAPQANGPNFALHA